MRRPQKKEEDSTPSNSVSAFPVAHISASSMIKFSSNPIIFKINYLNRDVFDTTMGASGVLGKAFHYAMEVYYGGSETLLPADEAEAIEFGLRAGMDYIEKYSDGFIEYNKTIVNKQKIRDLFTYCFETYVHEMPYRKDSIVAVEDEIKEEIDVEWHGEQLKLPVALKGYVDKVFREDGKLKLTDYKTCYTFSNPDKIDGAKILQAVEYYLLAFAKYGEAPYSITFEEVKYTKNADGGKQVRSYEVVFDENPLYFAFYFRFYEDFIRALNGEQVYVPNVHALFDNEVAIIAYIHRLDVPEETAKLMQKHQVDNITDLLKKEIQSAGNMRKLMKSVEEKFVSAKNLNYEKMKNDEKIQTKMLEHGMMLQFDSVINGASVDLYRYTPSIGLKMTRLQNYVADVEQVLGVSGVRVLAPIPNSTMVGFEVPRKDRTFPSMPSPTGNFEIAIGQTIEGDTRRFDIRTAPHMLVGGASGAGKSVFLHGLIDQLAAIGNAQLYLFDPKIVELAHHKSQAEVYESEPKDINKSLLYLVKQMDERYKKMAKAGAKNISEMTGMPYIFAIIDEFADLIMASNVEDVILKLAQKGRAAGIHLIIATQRPSVDVISGTIKANFPTKVVFRTAKETDSRVMLDERGAERLLGKGDMLFASEQGIERLQGFNV